MSLFFNNTRTRKKELFTALNSENICMYTCGPTVYNVAHIGNFMAYIDADLVQRYLRFWKLFSVTWVMNITDVDDKTIRDSATQYPDLAPNLRLKKFTEKYTQLFYEDLVAVGIDRDHIAGFPCATDHIAEMEALIVRIWNAGYAYEKNGSIYFDLKKYHDEGKYSELLNVDFSGFKAGVRIDADEYTKDNVQDFVLWKAYEDGEPEWTITVQNSPYRGRPGWHIECSAMSSKYLGNSFDIHTGGVDLIFPHHENEIAQSTAGNGVRHAQYWLHNEHLQVDGGKMSKSKGNFYTLRDIIDKGFDPKAFRMLVLSSHYRSKLNFTFEALEAAQEKIERVNELIRKLQRITEVGTENWGTRIATAQHLIEAALDDDLNTPEAWAVVFDFVRDINSESDHVTILDAKALLRFFEHINALFNVFTFAVVELPADIQKLISEREMARKNKDFEKSDEVRAELLNLGFEIEDTATGTVWKKISK